VRRGWLIANAIILAVFAIAIWLSLELALFDAIGPGAGFFPFWLGVIGCVLAALILFHTAAGRIVGFDAQRLLPQGEAAWRTISVVVALVIAAALIEPLGYRLTMLLFVAGLLLALGARHWLAIAAVAVAGSFGVFHVFYYWLKVPLPIGALGI